MNSIRTAALARLLSLCLVGSTSSIANSQTTPIPFTAVPPSATKITFETTPQGAAVPIGTPAANIWASIGVTFDADDGTSGPFALKSPLNVLNPGPSTTSTIRGTFSPSVSLVGAWGFDFVMEAFDGLGNSLGAMTHTDGSAGLFGGAAAEFGFLGVTSSTPIARVEFRHAFPNNQAFGFHIDDLVFVQGTPPPPRQLIAFTEFDEPPLGAGAYNPGAAGQEIGFTTVGTPTAGTNPLAGVAALDGNEIVFTHRSMNATTTFGYVDVANYAEVNVFARIRVSDTAYESGDLLRVFITNGTETVDLLNALGSTALNGLAGDGFLTYDANVPDHWEQVALVVTSFSNSSQAAERFDIDGIEFRGTVAIPEPPSAVLATLAAIAALVTLRTRRHSARA